jgi:hypothetical protein
MATSINLTTAGIMFTSAHPTTADITGADITVVVITVVGITVVIIADFLRMKDIRL